MMFLPNSAAAIPTGGPWGSTTPVAFDATLFVVALAAAVFAAAILALVGLASGRSHRTPQRGGIGWLRTHSA